MEKLQAEPRCIVQHPGFEAVCFNVWVLQTAWLQDNQQYGSSAYEGPQHTKHLHIAWRQLVRWCWGALGKNIGVPLPSCAVNCMRAHFPEPNQLLVLLMQMSRKFKYKYTGPNCLLLPFVMPLQFFGEKTSCLCMYMDSSM